MKDKDLCALCEEGPVVLQSETEDKKDKFVWSTDPQKRKQLEALYHVLPLVCKQYGATFVVESIEDKKVNIIFPKGTPPAKKANCWERVGIIMNRAGLHTG